MVLAICVFYYHNGENNGIINKDGRTYFRNYIN